MWGSKTASIAGVRKTVQYLTPRENISDDCKISTLTVPMIEGWFPASLWIQADTDRSEHCEMIDVFPYLTETLFRGDDSCVFLCDRNIIQGR